MYILIVIFKQNEELESLLSELSARPIPASNRILCLRDFIYYWSSNIHIDPLHT